MDSPVTLLCYPQILQNLLSSMGVQGGAAAGPAGGSGERLPPQHLLYTLDAYLSSLQRGQPSLQPIHVISLDPRVMREQLGGRGGGWCVGCPGVTAHLVLVALRCFGSS
jgi:hypothetical protein